MRASAFASTASKRMLLNKTGVTTMRFSWRRIFWKNQAEMPAYGKALRRALGAEAKRRRVQPPMYFRRRRRAHIGWRTDGLHRSPEQFQGLAMGRRHLPRRR